MKNKLTISDIAKAAGVSKTAVSFVLNNKEGVSAKTRQKVLDVIKETNYRPTMNSKRLFSKRALPLPFCLRKPATALITCFIWIL